MTSKGDPAADTAYWNEHLNDPDIDGGEVVEVEVVRPLTSTFSLRIPATEETRQMVGVMANRAALQQLVRRLHTLAEQESNELAHLSRLLAS